MNLQKLTPLSKQADNLPSVSTHLTDSKAPDLSAKLHYLIRAFPILCSSDSTYLLCAAPPTGLKLCSHFLHGLRMCMWFGHKPRINICHFFHIVNLVFYALIVYI